MGACVRDRLDTDLPEQQCAPPGEKAGGSRWSEPQEAGRSRGGGGWRKTPKAQLILLRFSKWLRRWNTWSRPRDIQSGQGPRGGTLRGETGWIPGRFLASPARVRARLRLHCEKLHPRARSVSLSVNHLFRYPCNTQRVPPGAGAFFTNTTISFAVFPRVRLREEAACSPLLSAPLRSAPTTEQETPRWAEQVRAVSSANHR